MPTVAAIDIGGTKTLVEIFEEGRGEAVASEELRTPELEEPVGDLAETVRRISSGRQLRAVGIGCPGPLDPLRGVILNPPNLSRDWWGLAISDSLSTEIGVPASLENDCNLGALGEWAHGSGREYDSVLYVTVSTGVGAGLVDGGREGDIFGGNRGFALELGHTVLETDGPVCGCGRHGCLEALTSGTAIARRALDLGWAPVTETTGSTEFTEFTESNEATEYTDSADSRAVAVAAEQGDPIASQALQEAASYLGKALVNFIYGFDPGGVVLGGGVTRSELFVGLVLEAVEREPVMPAFLGVPIVRAGLPGRSVIHGARTLAERLARDGA